MNDEPRDGSLLSKCLELIRLPNIFTAVADVLMGFLYVQPTPAETGVLWTMQPADGCVLGLLIAASSLLYAAGVVLNDVADVEIDRQERPERPLPSGRISLAAARRFGWLLLLLGVAAAWIVPIVTHHLQPGVAGVALIRPGLVATMLAALIIVYDLSWKNTPMGPLTMGACRALNVALGMSVIGDRFHIEHLLVAGGIGVYIMGVTWFSRHETQRSHRGSLLAATAVMMGGIALLAWLPHWGKHLVILLQQEPGRWYLVMGLLGAMTCWRCLWAVADPQPQRVQTAVAHAIISVVILDAAACFAVQDLGWAITILMLLVPMVVAGRTIRST